MDTCEFNDLPIIKSNSALIPVTHGEEACSPGHSWGAGVRPNYLIHYVISGKGVFYCGPNKFDILPGQIFVVFPGTVIKYCADKNDPWHYSWISFSGDEAKNIFAKMGITLQSPIFTLKNGYEALEVMRKMPNERGADLGENLRFFAGLYEFMALLLDNVSPEENSESLYLISAKRYVKAYYHEDISVESVAAHVGISRKYLFALFKKMMGISPKDYIINYRIKRATEFLKDKSLSIGNVAYSVGYKDPLTFSKMFKLKTGLSPSQYRDTK